MTIDVIQMKATSALAYYHNVCHCVAVVVFGGHGVVCCNNNDAKYHFIVVLSKLNSVVKVSEWSCKCVLFLHWLYCCWSVNNFRYLLQSSIEEESSETDSR
jgi:hypothetical protein